MPQSSESRAEPTPDRVRARIKNAWSVKRQWEPLLREAYQLGIPNRDLYHDHAPGADRMTRIFDSTAVTGAMRFAGRMQSEILPPFQRKMELEPGPFVADANRDALRGSLEIVNRMLDAVFDTGNFHNSAHEMLLDMAAGMGAMLGMEGDDNELIQWAAIPAARIALDETAWGRVGGIFARHNEHPENLKETWPDIALDAALTEQRRADDRNEDRKVMLDAATIWDPAERVWHYPVLPARKPKQTGDCFMVARAYATNPWTTPHYMKAPGEVHGRGPLLMAMPDIRTANKVVEMTLMNASLALAGIYTVADTEIQWDGISLQPGAGIPVRSNGGSLGPSIQPLETARNFDVAHLMLDDLRTGIKKILLDNQLPPDFGPSKSPEELVQRLRELNQDTGAAFGRLYHELIVPLAQRALDILHRKRLLPSPIKIDQLLIQVKVTGPLARSQKLAEVEAIV